MSIPIHGTYYKCKWCGAIYEEEDSCTVHEMSCSRKPIEPKIYGGGKTGDSYLIREQSQTDETKRGSK
jgi:hypothetical protein